MTCAHALNPTLSTSRTENQDQRWAAWAQTEDEFNYRELSVVEVGSSLTLEFPTEKDLKDLHPSYLSDTKAEAGCSLLRGCSGVPGLTESWMHSLRLGAHWFCTGYNYKLPKTLPRDRTAKSLKWVLCIHLRTSPTASAGSLVIPVLRGDCNHASRKVLEQGLKGGQGRCAVVPHPCFLVFARQRWEDQEFKTYLGCTEGGRG